MSLPLLPKSDQHPPFLKPSLLSSPPLFFNLLFEKYRQILITSVSHPDCSHLCEVSVSFQSAFAIFHPHNLHLHLLATNRILPPRRYSPSSYFSTPKGTHELLSINTLANIQSRYFCHNYFFYLFLFFSPILIRPPLLSSLSQPVPRGESETRKRKKKEKKKKEKKSTDRCDKARKRRRKRERKQHPIQLAATSALVLSIFA